MNNDKDVYDIELGINLTGGNKTLALELLSMLISQLPTHKLEITESIHANDMTMLKQHIHKLHGSSQCCATPALVNATKELAHIIDNNLSHLFESSRLNLFVEIDKVLQLDTNTLEP